MLTPTSLTRRIIPCLDVKDGRVVKGVKFQGLRDAGDPVERAAEYERQGADELVILDVSATPEGRANAAHTVEAVRAVLSIPLTVGGGVRTFEDAERLLAAGADKVGLNTAAVKRPELLTELSERVGRQCVVLSLDAGRHQDGRPNRKTGWGVITTSGTEREGMEAPEWAAEAERRGAGEILLTSWDRDGTREGYDCDLIRAVAAVCNLPIIASGGGNGARHMAEAFDAGADAVLAASIFHEGDTTVADIKAQLAKTGAEVRP